MTDTPLTGGPAGSQMGASSRHWHRFTLGERIMRSAFYIVVLIAITQSMHGPT